MQPSDPNFLIEKPKKERSPAQKLATQTAFSKLKEKREQLKAEKEQETEEVIEVRKIIKKPVKAAATSQVQKPVPTVENNMNDDMINMLVSRLKTELVPQPVPTGQVTEKPVKEKKKKVVVVEESDSSSSEEEVVIRRKKKEKAPEPAKVEPVKVPEPVKKSTGSRVLDNLFYR
jgi:hypothetical protein